jgi:nitroimidazol reductase NimA-like FMN-containing flavoprotein (pyridoxamine 5'-phosphate oxidase superfamily)
MSTREPAMVDEGLELLTEHECGALLATARIGRVGVTVGGLPVILPVNYTYLSGDVFFRTGEGTKFRAASGGAVIAFEVDAYDEAAQQGWSVLAIGRADIVTDPAEIADVDGSVRTPWAGGQRNYLVRLRPEVMTGRKIVGT